MIGENAFYGCENLSEITIPGSVKEIESRAFQKCKSLQKVVLNEGLETIRIWAFSECENLREIIIPASVKKIEWAFDDSCKCIPSGDSVMDAAEFCFDGITYSIPAIASTKALSREFADNVEHIHDSACWCQNGVQEECNEKCSECLLCSNAGDPEQKITAFLAYCQKNGIELEGSLAYSDRLFKKIYPLLDTDPEAAMKLIREAAEQGNMLGMLTLGRCYDQGELGVEKDPVEAAKWYRKAAEQGDVEGQFFLGACYRNGAGVEKDPAEAVKWYRKAAEQGFDRAQSALSTCYYLGEGVEKDLTEAVKWCRKAAENGNICEQGNLGYFYENGSGGLEKNAESALHWYKKAAEQGNSCAQANLGIFYYEGRLNTEKNYHEAVKWLARAAEQGDADAQFYLGCCYMNGSGLDRDIGKAVDLFIRAFDGGNKDAEEKLHSLGYQKNDGKWQKTENTCSVAYCLEEGKRRYGILTGSRIFSLNAEKKPEYMEVTDFLKQHGAKKLKVAVKNRIPINCHKADHAAEKALKEEHFPTTKRFVLKCLGVTDIDSVDEALEKNFGPFEWLESDLVEGSDERGSKGHKETSSE